MRNFKKLLAFMLALALCFTSIPNTWLVYASTDNEVIVDTDTEEQDKKAVQEGEELSGKTNTEDEENLQDQDTSDKEEIKDEQKAPEENKLSKGNSDSDSNSDLEKAGDTKKDNEVKNYHEAKEDNEAKNDTQTNNDLSDGEKQIIVEEEEADEEAKGKELAGTPEETFVAWIEEQGYTSLEAAIEAATASDTITLGSGEYTTYGTSYAKNKTLHFEGAAQGTTVWKYGETAAAVSGEGGGDYSLEGATVSFKNITFQDNCTSGNNVDWRGFIRPASMSFENCVFNSRNTYWGSGAVSFKDCTFAENGGYNLWVYSGTDWSFEGCTFYSNNARFVNAYMQANATVNVSFKDCLFTYTELTEKGATDPNPAIYLKSNSDNYRVNWLVDITNTSVTNDITALYGDKNFSTNPTDTQVILDGKQVYPSLDPVVNVDEEGNLTASIPAGAFSEEATESFTIAPESSAESKVSVTFDAEATRAIAAAANGSALTLKVEDTTDEGTTGKKTVEITLVDSSNHAVYSQTAGTATVVVPYDELTAGQGILVYLVSGNNRTKVEGTSYDAENHLVIFQVPHFSTYEINTVASIDVDGTPTAVYAVMDGFYQDGETYGKSSNFYITNKAGLEYLRDMVSACDGGTVAGNYASTFAGSSIPSWYSNNIFSNKTVHLLSDIDLENEDWTPIGYVNTAYGNGSSKTHFYGSFNGHNHVVSNLKIVGNEANVYKGYGSYGLFGYLGSRAGQTFSNLTVRNVSGVTGTNTYDYVGAIVGNGGSNAISFNNCHVDGNIQLTSSYQVGGLYGIGAGSVTNCTVKGSENSEISSEDYNAAGLAGCARAGVSVSNSTVEDITISAAAAGGLIGLNNNNATVTGNAVKDTVIAGTENAGIVSGNAQAPETTDTVTDNVTIPITGIKIASESSEVYGGETLQLTVDAIPATTTETLGEVTWSSSDESIATVAGGIVSAVAAGTATITATVGAYSDSLDITVAPVAKGGSDQSIVYFTFDDVAQVLDAAYSDGTLTLTKDVTLASRIYFYKDVTIDFAGHTVTVGETRGFYVSNESEMTLLSSGSDSLEGGMLLEESSAIAAYVQPNGTLNVLGGSFSSTYCVFYNNSGTLNISNGK